jgi:serine/threonine protein kinase
MANRQDDETNKLNDETNDETKEFPGGDGETPILPPELRERYIFIEKLEEGGYGEVYKIKDTKLGREFALKKLKLQDLPVANDPLEIDKLKDRFIQEAKILARCKHPNIVNIYELGGENDVPYLIMDYIEGNSLEYLIEEKGKLPFKEVLEKSEIILKALGHIHSKSLVHRDLTPKNILIEKENGRIVIIDFGIAKDLIGSDFIGPQDVIGNPYYMSPEQWRKSKDVDKRTDIYSFGVILFKMLTGEVPFKGTGDEISNQQLYEPVPDVMNSSMDAPWGIQKIIRKAMDKRPGNRYPDAGSLLDALKQLKYEDKDPFVVAIDIKLNDRYIFNGDREKGGYFSNVYRLRHRVYEGDYLLKIMDLEFILQHIRKSAQKDEDIEEAFNNRRERFIQKILFFQKLEHHPNIVNIADSGFIPIMHKKRKYEIPYLVVKKIEGPLLEELIEKKAPLELERIFKISGDILSALSKIHENGYIYWEVVPEKIIVEENSGKAIFISAGLTDDKDIYREAMVSETKLQIDMRIVDVLKYSRKESDQQKRGRAADIRLFGIVLYRMLTGDTHYDKKLLEILKDKKDEAILDKMEKNTGLPEGTAKKLARIIIKTMSEDGRRKYKNVKKIMDDLEEVKKAYSKMLKKK